MPLPCQGEGLTKHMVDGWCRRNTKEPFKQKVAARRSRNHKGRGVGGSRVGVSASLQARGLNEAAERPSGMDNFIL
jgi:hypothetical protein